MTSRRQFLTTMAFGATALQGRRAPAADAPEVKTALSAPVGLQLYSVREQLKKDVPGTLAKVRGFGIREVESAGTWGQSPAEHRAALDKAGLVCRASHMGLDKLQADIATVLRMPDFQQRMSELVMDATPMSREEFDRFIRADIARWAHIIKEAKIPLQ